MQHQQSTYMESLKTYCSDRRRLIAPVLLLLALIFVIASMCVTWMVSPDAVEFKQYSLSVECSLFSCTTAVSSKKGKALVTETQTHSKLCLHSKAFNADADYVSICAKILSAKAVLIAALCTLLASVSLILVLAGTMLSSPSNGLFNRVSKWLPTTASIISVAMLITVWSCWFSITEGEKLTVFPLLDFGKMSEEFHFSSGPFLAVAATVFSIAAAVCCYLFPGTAMGPPKVVMQYYQSNGQTMQVQQPGVQQQV